MNTKKYEMKNRAFDSGGKGGWVFFFSLFYYDTLKQLLSDQQFFTPLLTLCMPFWQVLLFLHMIKETKKNIDN